MKWTFVSSFAFLIGLITVTHGNDCVDRLPNCQSNLGLCTQAGELVFQNHYCKATCGNCGVSKETTVPVCPAEWNPVHHDLKERFIRGQIQFAWEFYTQIPLNIRVRKGANFVIGPNSLAQILAVLYEGSSGSTQELLKQTPLFDTIEDKDVRHVYAKMANHFRRQMAQPLPKANELYSSNLLVFGQEFKISETFLKTAAGCYDTAMMQRKDNNSAQIKEDINSAFQGFAYGLPKERILDAKDRTIPLDPKTLTIVSGTYFKSDLDAPTVVMEKFYPPTKTEGLDVPMFFIQNHLKLFVSEELNCKVVGIPFIHQAQTLFIILPNERYGLTTLERNLTWKAIYEMTRRAQFAWIYALVPKIHGHTVIDARAPMEKMDLKDVFNEPNLDNIFLGHNHPKPISNLYHRADFQMYEKYRYIIDNTTFTKDTVDKLKNHPQSFRAVHPFLFMVEDQRTGAIILLGRVLNPSVE